LRPRAEAKYKSEIPSAGLKDEDKNLSAFNAPAPGINLKSTHKSQASFSEFLEPSQAEVAALMTHISDGYTDTQPPGVLVVESFEWSPQKILI